MSTSQIDRQLASDKHTYELAPILGERWQMSWTFTAMIAWFTLLFLLINHTPLALDSTWQHVNAGSRYFAGGIAANAVAEVPLTQGMPAVAESWLFDAAAFLIADRFGPNTLSAVIALLGSAAIWVWCAVIYRASRSVRCTLFIAVALSVAWAGQSYALHSRLLGMLIFGLVMGTVYQTNLFSAKPDDVTTSKFSRSKFSRWQWLAVASLFALWANVEGSFWIGLATMLAIAIGVAYSESRELGLRAAVGSAKTQRWVLLFNLAAMATLANPQHIGIWKLAVTEKLDSLVAGVVSGQGLYLPTIMGLTVVAASLYLMWESKRSEKTLQPAATMLLATVAVLAMLSAANVYWLIPVVCLVAVSLRSPCVVAETEARAADDEVQEDDRPLRFAGSLCCVLLIWCAFALSTISTAVLGGKPRAENRIYQADVPTAVSGYLQDRSPIAPADFGWSASARPLIWAPADWSDWLLWDAPEGTRVFTTSQLDRLPPRVQADYAKVFRGEPGWDRLLDRYAVGTLVVDKHRQPKLAAEVMRHGGWNLVMETHAAMTLERAPLTGGDS